MNASASDVICTKSLYSICGLSVDVYHTSCSACVGRAGSLRDTRFLWCLVSDFSVKAANSRASKLVENYGHGFDLSYHCLFSFYKHCNTQAWPSHTTIAALP